MKRSKLFLLGTLTIGTALGLGGCISDLLYGIAPFLL